MTTIKQVEAVLATGELLKTTENYAVYGLRRKHNKKEAVIKYLYNAVDLVITCKRNPADAYLLYVIHDMPSSNGIMIKEQLKNYYIHKIAYSLEQSIKEVAELEAFIMQVSESIKAQHKRGGF